MTIITNVSATPTSTGLSISTSNVLIGVTPTITDTGVGEVAANISDPDHSLNYTCGSSAVNFTVSYGAQTNISYVGISGHNAATPAQATIQLYNDTTLIDSVVIKRNHNIMFTFPAQAFQDLKLIFITVPVTYQMTLSFIAAGQYLTISTGEQAGYKRAWLNRSTTQKTTTNLTVAPIASTVKSNSLKGSLSFPNEVALFTEGDWQDFIDFSFEQPFFIKEQASKPESSYLCFDPSHDIKAHPQTRELDAIMLKFTAYNGL
jgi:hypothetical protein